MNKDLTVGKPYKVLWMFCIPLFGSVIFQQLYNLADSWVAGNFIGQNALAAVGNSYEITLIFLAISVGCNIGCSVITSRYFGAKEFGKMKTSIYTAVIFSTILCGILMILGLSLSGVLLKWMDTPLELLNDSKLYLDIYVWGLPFVFFYNIATGIFSAMGDSKTPFIFLAISSVSNIAMDILFVAAFQMGVAGVAWATFICQGVSCILAMLFVFLRINKIKCEDKVELFSIPMLKQFLIIALPSMLQQSFISFGNIIIQKFINGYGPEVIAGYSAAIKLNNLVIVSFATIGNGVSNYTSQNVGAGKLDRLRPGFNAGVLLVWLISIPVILLYCLLPQPLLNFFIQNPTELAVDSASIFLRIVAPFYLFASVKLMADGVLRGAGKMWSFMIATGVDLVLRCILAFAIPNLFDVGYVGIWMAWPIGWLVALAMSLIFFYSYTRKVKQNKTPVKES
ncbi:MAG: MATE family efflux transporter [Bacilli bacterium]|nr:MATE family efflux transporter [Bacilli bacterium]